MSQYRAGCAGVILDNHGNDLSLYGCMKKLLGMKTRRYLSPNVVLQVMLLR
jgi:hypothetical protein